MALVTKFDIITGLSMPDQNQLWHLAPSPIRSSIQESGVNFASDISDSRLTFLLSLSHKRFYHSRTRPDQQPGGHLGYLGNRPVSIAGQSGRQLGHNPTAGQQG